jgi:hypothetical protein
VLLEMGRQDAERLSVDDPQAREVEHIQRNIQKDRGTFCEEMAALWKLCGL